METDKALARIKQSSAYARDEGNRLYIGELERTLERIKTDHAFQETDQVKLIKAELRRVITLHRKRLIEEDNAEKRLKIKAYRDACVWLLGFFARDLEKELRDINDQLEDALGKI